MFWKRLLSIYIASVHCVSKQSWLLMDALALAGSEPETGSFLLFLKFFFANKKFFCSKTLTQILTSESKATNFLWSIS